MSDKETAGDSHCPSCGDPYIDVRRDRNSTTIVHAVKEHEQGGETITESCTVAAGFGRVDDPNVPELFEQAHEAVADLHGAIETFPATRRIADARENLINAEKNWSWNNGD